MARFEEGATYELACVKKAETENAVLIFDPVSDEDIWIPLSQIHEMHWNQKGEGRIVMTEWIAKKKGLL
jgi:hypothetical protein